MLSKVKQHAGDKELQVQWRAVKQQNKQRLANYIKVPPSLLSLAWGTHAATVLCDLSLKAASRVCSQN